MANFLRKLFQGLHNGWLGLLSFTVFLILAWGTLAPVGTMVWWLDSEDEDFGEQARWILSEDDAEAVDTEPTCYIVFLTGVGDFSADNLASGEEIFLDRLEQAQPHCVMVRDVFPYSAANQNIGGQEVFAFLWEIAENADGWLEATRYLLQIRNLWRLAISADNRYGQIYNPALALSILEQMNKQHSVPSHSDEPIQLILMGTSGGAQVGLSATPYLKDWLNAEITLLSFGGVFDGQEGFDAAEQVYHFRGEADWVENLGGILFPSRWLWNFGSSFNQARDEGRYTAIISGPHEHDGDRGYFGEDPIENSDETYLDRMFEEMMELPIWDET
ncbi:hypothetical protein [Egbenema bharatensis]|uniref:hypothetical protein n=1 Tax=Egbenema bharatensis TaxID=3463334 RepID=UPI003A86BFB1